MESAYDKTNVSAYKYQESVHERVADMCEPLTQYFGVKLSCSPKIKPDGNGEEGRRLPDGKKEVF